ncbi:MAG: DHH family phosphoesterase [Candidatus Saccharibacteria bacterium]|nr:DHH family phosphoesterase [Candidatus Saccharibacteria bacterium]
MYDSFREFLEGKKKIAIIQAENPDGDSLGSALALEGILADYEVSLYCPVQIPTYMRYFDGWGRVTAEFDFLADGYIIVDTASNILLSKLLEDSAIRKRLYNAPVFVLDHHESEDDLEFSHMGLIQELPACCSLILRIAKELEMLEKADKSVYEYLYYGILSDTLGLTTATTGAKTFMEIGELVERGELEVDKLEEKRRQFSKKSERIFKYKADLIQHTEFFLDGKLAAIHIPWEEIHEFSNEYNPNALIMEELRMVAGVEVALAVKTYPDGRVTGKIRTTEPIAQEIAEFYGGGGHPYAAGFRTYDVEYEEVVREVIEVIDKLGKKIIAS